MNAIDVTPAARCRVCCGPFFAKPGHVDPRDSFHSDRIEMGNVALCRAPIRDGDHHAVRQNRSHNHRRLG